MGRWTGSQIEFHGLTDQMGLDFHHRQENVQKARSGVFGEESPEGRKWAREVPRVFQEEDYASGWDRLVDRWQKVRGRSKRAALRGLMQDVSQPLEMIR